MKQLKTFLTAVIGTALIVLLCVSCDQFMGLFKTEDEKDTAPSYGSSVSRTVTVSVSADEEIYLVKYNPNSGDIPAAYSGTARVANQTALPQAQALSMQQSRQQTEVAGQSAALNFAPQAVHHRGAMEFNANPPEFTVTPRRMSRAAPPAEGTSRQFWVQYGPDSNSPWIQRNATLKKNGTYCRIWVDNEHFGTGSTQINQTAVDNLAAKFDLIYQKETAFFGYEYGGGPGGNGGIDGDPLIQIFVYDIDFDVTPGGGTLGFFWGKDEYTQDNLRWQGYSDSQLRSNAAEIFYVDAYFTKILPNTMYSTLAHEFQHMIQFNEKFIKKGLNSESWYNEMLSMLAEDMLDRHIGINPPADITTYSGHPIYERIPRFKNFYWASGVTDWLSGYNVYFSYSNAYAFGAYLVRNYGGAKLLYEMAHNDYANIASVNAALASTASITFDKALEKFPEVLFNNTGAAGTASFKQTGAAWNPYPPGITPSDYTFGAFDIGTGLYGPSSPQPIRPYGIEINYVGTAGGTGQASFTIENYSESPVKMYFLGKKNDGTVERLSGIYP
ncbi:MAG: hypothetical protein Pg6C_13020 [Treponemataceae bacterium]|nr:MAG: hypothetical protein Pg6C_13020 [Treponemataceae bacterium]